MLEHLKRNTEKDMKEVISQSNLSTRRQKQALLENVNVPRKVKRTLLCHNVLILELKNKYKKNKRDKQRHILSESMPEKILKTYRLLLKSKFIFSRKRHLANTRRPSNFTYDRLSKITKVRLQEINKIRDFYVRDDNIILTADIITRFKI